MSTTPHSNHIFLFPFKWEIHSGKKHDSKSLSERTPLNKAVQLLDMRYWVKFDFKPKVHDGFNTYNEYAYFYEFARDVLNLDEDEQNGAINEKQYQYKGLSDDSVMRFNIKGKWFDLVLKDVLLGLYEQGIGVLSFFLENHQYDTFEDVLKINDFGRRIYPQFLLSQEPFTSGEYGPKQSFLCQEIVLRNVSTFLGSEVSEDFTHYDRLSSIQERRFVLPAHLRAFLGRRFYGYADKHVPTGDARLYPVLDDRMFVVSHCFNGDKSKEFQKQNVPAGQTYNWENNPDWYQYVFVDSGGPTCRSKNMLKQQIEQSTYHRWADDGTLYGVTRYSFILLTDRSDFARNVLNHHMKNMYFQMALLCLLQRAYVLNFSGEVARISSRLGKDSNKLSAEKRHISDLSLQYIKFVNRVFFREITPQEQGIELYDMLQSRMRIQKDVDDLDKEIQELNTYVETAQQGELTWIAGQLLPATLLAGVLGANFWGERLEEILPFGVSLLLIVLTLVFSNQILKIFKPKK